MICCIAAIAVMGVLTKLLGAPATWLLRSRSDRAAATTPPPARYDADTSTGTVR